mgnify:CR=1 FL=1
MSAENWQNVKSIPTFVGEESEEDNAKLKKEEDDDDDEKSNPAVNTQQRACMK